MIEIRCKSCGSIELSEEGIYYVCLFCGARQKRETPSLSLVDQKDTIQRLINKADLFWSSGMKEQAKKIYSQILEIDSTNEIAKSRILSKE